MQQLSGLQACALQNARATIRNSMSRPGVCFCSSSSSSSSHCYSAFLLLLRLVLLLFLLRLLLLLLVVNIESSFVLLLSLIILLLVLFFVFFLSTVVPANCVRCCDMRHVHGLQMPQITSLVMMTEEALVIAPSNVCFRNTAQILGKGICLTSHLEFLFASVGFGDPRKTCAGASRARPNPAPESHQAAPLTRLLEKLTCCALKFQQGSQDYRAVVFGFAGW